MSGAPRWFWPFVVVGTIGGWGLAWAVWQAVPITVGFAPRVLGLWGVAAVVGVLWYREDQSLLAAGSFAVPLAVVWTVNLMLELPLLVHLAIFALGFGAFLFVTWSSARTAWWYRVVLRSRRQPPV